MIKIICVGKIKEKYLKDGINDYLKRMRRYTKVEIVELTDLDKFPINEILKREGEAVLKQIKQKDYVITLEIDGQKLNSIKFSEKIDSIFNNNPNICFVIGGSYGISDEVKKRSDFKLSFSDFTYPHQLFRLILLEQIYRSFKIINNESYHK